MKDGITGSRGDVAIKTVKAKRDANEAGEFLHDPLQWSSFDVYFSQIRSIEKAFIG